MNKWNQIIRINSEIDPRLFQVNRRIKGGHWIKPETRKAMEDLESITYTQMEYEPPSNCLYRLELDFTFPTMNSDVDGPIKRVVDSVFRGMRRKFDVTWVNDARVVHIKARKRKGNPATSILVAQWLDGDE